MVHSVPVSITTWLALSLNCTEVLMSASLGMHGSQRGNPLFGFLKSCGSTAAGATHAGAWQRPENVHIHLHTTVWCLSHLAFRLYTVPNQISKTVAFIGYEEDLNFFLKKSNSVHVHIKKQRTLETHRIWATASTGVFPASPSSCALLWSEFGFFT